jgi:hypothetical protein
MLVKFDAVREKLADPECALEDSGGKLAVSPVQLCEERPQKIGMASCRALPEAMENDAEFFRIRWDHSADDAPRQAPD